MGTRDFFRFSKQVHIPFSSVRRCVLCCIALLAIAPARTLFAWGDEGHEIIGVIAYARLTPSVRQKIDAQLAADNDNLTGPDFISRTTWADKYRDSDRHTTRIRYEATRNWHFVDIEIAGSDIAAACNQHAKLPRGTVASAGPTDACVVDKIDQFITEMRNPATTKAEKVLALKFLLHFIGDVHQPLHSADNKDRGGNEVPVLFGDRTTPENLHAYWDTHLVQRLGNNPRIVGATINKQMTKLKVDAWSKGTATSWAMESFRQAKNVAYNFAGAEPFTDDHGVAGWRLDTAYDNRGLPVVREQLSKAGVRLATVLNSALK